MTSYYFAYGSNLNHNDWVCWCTAQGVAPDGLREVTRAYLPDWDVRFHYYSVTRAGGALDIVPSIGHAVHGWVFEADERTWEVLDRKEGAGERYEHVSLVAIDEEGREFPVVTYRVRQENVQGFTAPTSEYLSVVADAFQERGTPLPGNIAQASVGAPSQSLVQGMFVYGTLRPGECRFPFLEPFHIKHIQPAHTTGTLYDLGPFPGMTVGPGAQRQVSGEWVLVQDQSSALRELDRIEGFLGYGEADNLYRRAIRPVRLADGGSALAWVYLFVGSLEPGSLIESGDWRRR